MKYSLLFLLIPMLAFTMGKGVTLEKEINRQFNIQSNGVLKIDNRYGAIDITTGTSNQIKINVKVIAEASNTSKAQESLDRVAINFEEGGNTVTAATELKSNSGIKSWFSNDDMNVEINYTVVVPVDIYLKLINRYGSIYVETTNKDLEVDLSYGEIRLGDVNADVNLEMAYSEGSLSNIHNGKIKLQYSELEMEQSKSVDIQLQYTDLALGHADNATIDAAYSDFEAGEIGTLTYTGKYADVAIEKISTINTKSAYTDMGIGLLTGGGSIAMTYGEMAIKEVGAGFAGLEINTSYTDVALKFQENSVYTIEAQTSYCDIKHSDLKVLEQIEKAGSTSFKGSNGSGGGKVTVKMTYGELEIN